MTALLLAVLLGSAASPPVLCADLAGTPLAAATDSLEAYWEAATPFDEFYAGVEARAELWRANYEGAELPGGVVERARAVVDGGPVRLLAIAVDGCSDSVSTLPYLARLADAVSGLELRVLAPSEGRALQDARRTADGRTATPTVVVLGPDFQDLGCFIERPRPLKAWIAEQEASPSGSRGVYEGKMRWYAEDGGRSTLEEVVGIVEAAESGQHICVG